MAAWRPVWLLCLCLGIVCPVWSSLTYNGKGGLVGQREGEQMELVCSFGKPVNGVDWSKNRVDLQVHERFLLAGNETAGHFTLTILNLTRIVDDGTYACTEQGVGEETTPFQIQVSVYYFPDAGNPTCEGETEIQTGVGQTFTCRSNNGNPPVIAEWTRDDMDIDLEDIRKVTLENQPLELFYDLMPTKADIGVTLTCTIDSPLVFSNQKSSCHIGPLVVKFPPSDVHITNITYTDGNTSYAALFCNASAYPAAITYEWQSNVPLNSSQLTVANDSQILLLNVTSCEEYPVFAVCLATNEIGRASANSTICEPPPPPTTTPVMTTTTATTTTTRPQPTTAGPRPTTPQESTARMTTATESSPEAVVLTPALYSIIIIGACMVVVTVVILVCFARWEREKEAKKRVKGEVLDTAYIAKGIRSLSIAYNENEIDEGCIVFGQLGSTYQDLDNQGLDNQGSTYQSLDNQGLDNQSLDNQGLDNQGLDNQGFDNQGWTYRGLDNQSFEQGLDNQGLDNQGLDNQGLDNQGLDNQGLDNQGLDNQGLDNQGLDNQGLDNQSLDNQGLDNQSFDQGLNNQISNVGDGEPKESPPKTNQEDVDESSADRNPEMEEGDKDFSEGPDDGEDETMVTPTVQEAEDPRKSLVQEALLAMQVTNPTETGRGGVQTTHAMDI